MRIARTLLSSASLVCFVLASTAAKADQQIALQPGDSVRLDALTEPTTVRCEGTRLLPACVCARLSSSNYSLVLRSPARDDLVLDTFMTRGSCTEAMQAAPECAPPAQ